MQNNGKIVMMIEEDDIEMQEAHWTITLTGYGIRDTPYACSSMEYYTGQV